MQNPSKVGPVADTGGGGGHRSRGTGALLESGKGKEGSPPREPPEGMQRCCGEPSGPPAVGVLISRTER